MYSVNILNTASKYISGKESFAVVMLQGLTEVRRQIVDTLAEAEELQQKWTATI